MIKTFALLMMVSLLMGCVGMPGMSNPNLAKMQMLGSTKKIDVHPVLIPITPTLILDQRIAAYTYRVAPADVLDISVWRHPEFNPQEMRANTNSTPSVQGASGQVGYLVDQDGQIYFPLVGYVDVKDKTVDEIRISITARLRKYVVDPQVNVRVSDFRGQKVYVFGEVMKPGFLPINDQPLSITDALTLVGSIDHNAADTSHIYVIRGDLTHPKVYWFDARTPDALLLGEHFDLRPGDIVYVSSAAATRWNRILNQLLPTIQTIWYTKTITNT